MKTEELTALGLSEEQAKSVLAMNGKDIESTKSKFGDYDAIKTQLGEANKTIESYKSMDIDGIKQSAEEWKTKAETAQNDFTTKLQKIEYETAAKNFIDGLKPKDELSKQAILGEFLKNEFKLKDGVFQGANEWADTTKKEHSAHFNLEGDSKIPRVVSQTPGATVTGDDKKEQTNAAFRAAFGKE